MNKKVKGCLVILAVFFLIIVSIIGLIYHQMATSRERQDDDIAECAKTEFITEQPYLSLEKKINKNITEVNIQLKRNGQIIKSLLVKDNIENNDQYFIFKIPFSKFLKTDSILVKTKTELYTISGFAYSSDGGHWGMFGYLGDSECYFDYNQIKINGKEYSGITEFNK